MQQPLLHFYAKMQHPLLAFLGFLFQYLDSTNPEASDCNNYCFLLCPFVIVFQNWYLWVPEECKHHFLLIATFWISSFIRVQVVYTMPQLTSSLHHFCEPNYTLDPPPLHPFCLGQAISFSPTVFVNVICRKF
jgi:hypothetical protein